jgi:uncharacterized membrane protein (UPF0182 family)
MQEISMERFRERKYILISALSSFVIPIILMAVIFLVGFGPPESDSAEVQGFVFTLALFPFIYVFQVVAYWVLGKAQNQRKKPSFWFGSIVGAVLALPLSIVVLGIGFVTGASYWEAIMGATIFMFIPLWLSFTMGSATQYYLMVRHA